MSPLFLIRYDEIALKGHNRPFFEEALVKNIKEKCHNLGLSPYIEKRWGRVYVQAPPIPPITF